MMSSASGDHHFASALSTAPDLADAVADAGEQLREGGLSEADLTVVFVSHAHSSQWDRLPALVRHQVVTQHLIGCSGEAIVGCQREVEEGPALAIWTARLANSRVIPLKLSFERTPEGGAIVGWPDSLFDAWPTDAVILLLAEPFSFPADYLLQRMNEDQPGVAVVGGMASGGTAPGVNRLFFDERPEATGAVGVVLDGGVQVTSVVSQGCRPIGKPLVVTKAQRNLIEQLGGRPALQQLQTLFQQLPNQEKLKVQQGLHLGRTVSEYRDQFQPGDFLIRNVLGVDHESGAVAVGDYIRPGQTVQFHIRDEESADVELRQQLARQHPARPPQSALLFTCNGRGTRLFSQPHHDAQAIAGQYGDIPLAGFFAQGEMGPVDGLNFLHGFTASVALFS
jgi:small ligand-binding sensory domain FIST